MLRKLIWRCQSKKTKYLVIRKDLIRCKLIVANEIVDKIALIKYLGTEAMSQSDILKEETTGREGKYNRGVTQWDDTV